MSAALLYTVHSNQVNAFILVGILVILTCLVNVKYCSDFYAEEEFILCVRDKDFCCVSKVSCVGLVRKPFWVNLRELSNFGEQLFRKIIWNKGWPTWWHLLYYLLLNMFRMLIHPSSRACDYLVRYCVGCNVLTWGVLVLCSGTVCWWCGIRV